MAEQILGNARLVLADEVVHGSVLLRDGRISEVNSGATAVPAAEDLGGDTLLPGLIDLHTDHFEKHVLPRPGTRWDMVSAVMAHDAQMAAGGITTSFDCVCVGVSIKHPERREIFRPMIDAVREASTKGMLRADHIVHLRCEVTDEMVVELFDAVADHAAVGMMSLMDHAPGQRQFQTMGQYTLYYKVKRGLSDEAFARYIEMRKAQSDRYSAPHRKVIAEHCQSAGVTLASHDDATLDHVGEAIGEGVRLAEFPTSIEAARASHEAGMSVLMGAPNVVRGGSHSGNIAARDLAEAGILDVLSSDYIPFSLLHAAFRLSDEVETISLPKTIAMVTSTPARTVGLEDRGSIEVGKRADIVRVRVDKGIPVVRSVWREGERVA